MFTMENDDPLSQKIRSADTTNFKRPVEIRFRPQPAGRKLKKFGTAG